MKEKQDLSLKIYLNEQLRENRSQKDKSKMPYFWSQSSNHSIKWEMPFYLKNLVMSDSTWCNNNNCKLRV